MQGQTHRGPTQIYIDACAPLVVKFCAGLAAGNIGSTPADNPRIRFKQVKRSIANSGLIRIRYFR